MTKSNLYAQTIRTKAQAQPATPVTAAFVKATEPLPGTTPNHGGGYAFTLDPWKQLTRFLCLGTVGGTYYVSEKSLTDEALNVVKGLIAQDGVRAVDEIVAVSLAGRAYKQDPTFAALALALTAEAEQTRSYAAAKVGAVCRTGTHILTLVSMLDGRRGYGKAVRRALGNWYAPKTTEEQAALDVAFQVAKYGNRAGWTHRDVVRMAHPKPFTDLQRRVLAWIAAQGRDDRPVNVAGLGLIETMEQIREAAKAGDEAAIIRLVEGKSAVWEIVPTEAMTPAVWKALLPTMGPMALTRNVGQLTAKGVLSTNDWDALKLVCSRLTNATLIKRSRIHPMHYLLALVTYNKGHGIKGSLQWEPVAQVSAALETGLNLAFANPEPTGKVRELDLDVSGSMTGATIAGTFLTAREASVAMALATVKTEPMTILKAFSHDLMTLKGVTAQTAYADACRVVDELPYADTNIGLPIQSALAEGRKVDSFEIYTDNECNAGYHVADLLREYRAQVNPEARLVVVGMTATDVSVNSPDDPLGLDVAGFDAAAPQAIADFVAGKL